MINLLLDVNLSIKWIDFLKDSGINCTHWLAVGNCDDTDTEIFDYATANDFAVFTHDLDFGTILSKQKSSKPSVIQLRTKDTLPMLVGEKVVSAVNRFEKELEAGCILTIDINRNKIRLLPI
jgi:predicted nuclease of predicted toxin-antitoxin system